jgi:hypothetical protein
MLTSNYVLTFRAHFLFSVCVQEVPYIFGFLVVFHSESQKERGSLATGDSLVKALNWFAEWGTEPLTGENCLRLQWLMGVFQANFETFDRLMMIRSVFPSRRATLLSEIARSRFRLLGRTLGRINHLESCRALWYAPIRAWNKYHPFAFHSEKTAVDQFRENSAELFRTLSPEFSLQKALEDSASSLFGRSKHLLVELRKSFYC